MLHCGPTASVVVQGAVTSTFGRRLRPGIGSGMASGIGAGKASSKRRRKRSKSAGRGSDTSIASPVTGCVACTRVRGVQ